MAKCYCWTWSVPNVFVVSVWTFVLLLFDDLLLIHYHSCDGCQITRCSLNTNRSCDECQIARCSLILMSSIQSVEVTTSIVSSSSSSSSLHHYIERNQELLISYLSYRKMSYRLVESSRQKKQSTGVFDRGCLLLR